MFLHLSTFRPDTKHISAAVNLQVEVPKVWTALVLASAQEQTSVGACKTKRQVTSVQTVAQCFSLRSFNKTLLRVFINNYMQ